MWHSQLSQPPPPALGTPEPLSDPQRLPKPELPHACNAQPPRGNSPPGLHPWLCVTHRSFPSMWFSNPSPLQGPGGCWQVPRRSRFPSSGLGCLCPRPARVWVYLAQTWGQNAVQDRAVRSLAGFSRAAFKLRLLPAGPLHELHCNYGHA